MVKVNYRFKFFKKASTQNPHPAEYLNGASMDFDKSQNYVVKIVISFKTHYDKLCEMLKVTTFLLSDAATRQI